MPSGTHLHLKRIAAPTSWGLAKSEGKFAIRPLPGGFPKTLSIPVKYVVERFLKVAHTAREVHYILESKMISVNGKDVVNAKTTVGLFDVVTVKKTNQHYRLILTPQRKFKLHKISSEEAQFRITKIRHKMTEGNIPYTCSIDGFNFRFVDPAVEITDTVKVDISTKKVVEYLKFEPGNVAFVYSGSNTGRVGVIKRIEKLRNGDANVYLEDANAKAFTVMQSRAMVIGTAGGLLITLDEQAGIKLNDYELFNQKYAPASIEVEDN